MALQLALLTKLSSLFSPPKDFPESPYLNFPRARVDGSAAAHLESKVELPGVRLTDVAYILLGFYLDWAHKILVSTLMEESTKMVSSIQNETIYIYIPPTHCYDVPPGWVGNRFVSALAAEIYGIRGQKWNTENLIIFKMVILKQAQIVTGTNNISTQIDARLYLWNRGAFDELVCDYYAADTVFLWRSRC